MPLTSPGNDDDTGENHQPTLRKNTAEPVEQTLKQNMRRWVQGIRNSGSTKAADNRTPEENELIELRKRDRQLEMEVDVSEQAAPVFARKQA